ncbi:hypothetical protein [Zhihengliuella flava]|uniref:Uncharacterized protein n=1 Tax=Zhihengliuella flava TaxID=1285193 RepID=A0A931DBK7_9MICC|nr:hypothetical protein [Zhihengliuella flava]MBG6085452.1 hypothetical protein [Zhihengliuella flava]
MRKHGVRAVEPRRAHTARRVGAVVVLLAALSAAVTGAHLPHPTEAAWADAEHARGTLAAGEVLRPVNMTCTKPALASQLQFRWTNPTGGLTRQQYRWEFYNPGVLGLGQSPTRTGTLNASATGVNISISLGDLLDLGQGNFRLYAVGPGGWESGVNHTYNATAVLVSCGSASNIPR